MRMEEKKKDTWEASEDMVVQYLKQNPRWYHEYCRLEGEWKERFLDVCTGKRTMPLLYDPFFKRLFHPDLHDGRLSGFLSSLLGRKVKVLRILPTEETLLDGGALLIMDLLVELSDGILANVEVQKIPYLFPAERMSCYSADLLLRQYSRVKGEKGKKFKYEDVKKVYTIVLFEKSIRPFHETGNSCVHYGKTRFETGLKLELLQEYYLIALDVFREIPYPKDRTNQGIWLSVLSAETMEELEGLAEEFPWVKEIYEEMAGYMHRPEEVLNMFSEALRILDRNTVQYMIEQQQEQIKEQAALIEEQKRRLEEQEAELKRLRELTEGGTKS